MRKKRSANAAFFLFVLLYSAAAITVLHSRAMNRQEESRSGMEKRIFQYFRFDLPDEAQLLFSDESVGFGDGRYFYIYDIPEDRMEAIAAANRFSGWSPLPFPAEVSMGLKDRYDGCVIGEQLREHGFFLSKEGWYRFADLKGRSIDFLSAQDSRTSRDYTFCVFDRQQNRMLFLIGIY